MDPFGNMKARKRVEDRLAAVERLVDTLERQNRKVALEYIELYDKVSHQMSRMAKRYSRDKSDVNDAPVIEPVEDGVDPISAKIHARRGFLRNQA